ncbi:hypothetical protein HQ865_11350 [Mucilaginibacter mali]|uniref:Uncharacterized protein n=1 Tax=Mucilaginibacter mali TaxID=2740462 RepID=A0A7D4Q3J2_9SPHI|nr:hypothetical protein [Mucilaginibacter mali]QKJ30327.1 hypothetical protein HQ865_11350 [Mucilaginibacter mali]
MTKETLQQDLQDATIALIKLAEELTWNKISRNIGYIITVVDNRKNSIELYEDVYLSNGKKKPQTLSALIPELEELYLQMYDVFVYRVLRDETIIEIKYFFREFSQNENHQQIVAKEPPTLHCKILVPYYMYKRQGKFDINWQHNTIEYKWFRFLTKLKYKLTGRF